MIPFGPCIVFALATVQLVMMLLTLAAAGVDVLTRPLVIVLAVIVRPPRIVSGMPSHA